MAAHHQGPQCEWLPEGCIPDLDEAFSAVIGGSWTETEVTYLLEVSARMTEVIRDLDGD